MWFILLGRAEPERVATGVVSSNFFDVLGVQPLFGRTFRAADDAPGAPAVLMLSHKYWQRSFGGDPSIVGQVFQMNDRPHRWSASCRRCRSIRRTSTSTCRRRHARSDRATRSSRGATCA